RTASAAHPMRFIKQPPREIGYSRLGITKVRELQCIKNKTRFLVENGPRVKLPRKKSGWVSSGFGPAPCKSGRGDARRCLPQAGSRPDSAVVQPLPACPGTKQPCPG